MARKTYYVVQPFMRQGKTWRPGEAREVPDKSTAIRIAERFREQNKPILAFARSGDPDLGEWDDAELISSFQVPSSFFPGSPDI